MSHTVYHTADGQVKAVLATEDPEFEMNHRLAGVVLRKTTADVDSSETARMLCERGRVVDGKVVVGPASTPGAPPAVDLNTVQALVADGVAKALPGAVAEAMRAMNLPGVIADAVRAANAAKVTG